MWRADKSTTDINLLDTGMVQFPVLCCRAQWRQLGILGITSAITDRAEKKNTYNTACCSRRMTRHASASRNHQLRRSSI